MTKSLTSSDLVYASLKSAWIYVCCSVVREERGETLDHRSTVAAQKDRQVQEYLVR